MSGCAVGDIVYTKSPCVNLTPPAISCGSCTQTGSESMPPNLRFNE